ncbi:hypothetical protein ASC96_31095 [Rhizobium sp. Root1204]|nr:hypothetical protein ASC96_31095 [Rhizobium sp. Root1204]
MFHKIHRDLVKTTLHAQPRSKVCLIKHPTSDSQQMKEPLALQLMVFSAKPVPQCRVHQDDTTSSVEYEIPAGSVVE